MAELAYAADYHSDRDAAWGFGNAILYRMCKDKPRHDDITVAASKFWLIGRAYAASPQRGSGKSKVGPKEDISDG